MISREDAYNLAPEFWWFESKIDEIYDSIGSCGECKYRLQLGICKIHSEDAESDVVMMNHDFCSYFESK